MNLKKTFWYRVGTPSGRVEVNHPFKQILH